MILVRRFDELALRLRLSGEINGVVHPYIGQEAVAIGAVAALRDDDQIVSHHRGHGHCIAKGVSLPAMTAELLGRRDGICGGKGGSMHIADFDRGIVGANGIVGAGLPIGAGAALAATLERSDRVVAVFFGDGAVGQGVFHEALNYSVLASLPVIWICENNGYAAGASTGQVLATGEVARLAAGHGMPSTTVDGSDVLAVQAEVAAAVDRARAAQGPSLVECRTYRWGVHAQRGLELPETRGSDYVDNAHAADPIALFAGRLQAGGELSAEILDEIQKSVDDELADALAFARNSPPPDPASAYTHVRD